MLSLGTYPEVSLKGARKRATMRASRSRRHRPERGTQGRQGARPASEGRSRALADAGLPGPGTFEAVARDWLDTVHEHKVSSGHAERTRIRFEQDAFPVDRPANPIAEDGGARPAYGAAPGDGTRCHRNSAPAQGRMLSGVPIRHRHRGLHARPCGRPARRAAAGAGAPPCRHRRAEARRRTAASDGRLRRPPCHPCGAVAVGSAVPAAGRAAADGMGMGRSGRLRGDDPGRPDEAQEG
jgi:hypothetical protein